MLTETSLLAIIFPVVLEGDAAQNQQNVQYLCPKLEFLFKQYCTKPSGMCRKKIKNKIFNTLFQHFHTKSSFHETAKHCISASFDTILLSDGYRFTRQQILPYSVTEH